jgi:hypothetical protein
MYNHQTKKRKNSRNYDKTIASFETEKEVKKYLEKNNLSYAGSPYIFTHIKLNDGSILTCSYNGIICSPEKLRDYLIN